MAGKLDEHFRYMQFAIPVGAIEELEWAELRDKVIALASRVHKFGFASRYTEGVSDQPLTEVQF